MEAESEVKYTPGGSEVWKCHFCLNFLKIIDITVNKGGREGVKSVHRLQKLDEQGEGVI